MVKKIEKWCKALSNLQQLLLIFLGSWIMWFGIEIFGRWFSGEDYPVVHLGDFLFSFFMGIVWTLSFAYYKVKRLFTKKQSGADGK